MSRKFYPLLLGLVLLTQSAFAQVTTGTISGTVRDETGAVLPGVTVNLKHQQTGALRSLVSDEEGRYRAPNLALGTYEVAATLVGFQTEVRTGITLTIGREAAVDFTLKLGDMSETITVSGEAPLVDTTTSSVAGLIDERAIRDMPLSGRDFIQLALLEPSVLRIGNTDNTISKGFGTRTTFAGSRPRQNTFLMDGTNVNNQTNFGVPGSVAGVVLGVDTVREFQVLVGSYSAEYAGAGGTLSAVTKSGTNDLHGTAFLFWRDDALDSKNYFDQEEPPFSRNQYGGTVGGPIKRDRLFFFGSYEGLRDRLGITRIGIVPDENARRGLLPDPRNPGRTISVPVNPAVVPYLNLSPMPNGRNLGDGTAEYIWSGEEPTNQLYLVGKLDYRYGASNSVFVRYTYDDSDTFKRHELPLWASLWRNTSNWLTAENRTVLSDRTFFVTRFGYTNSDVFGDDVLAPGQSIDQNLSFVKGLPLGSSDYVPSRDSRTPRVNISGTFQYSGQMVLERGNHSLKFGGDFTQHAIEYVGISHLSGTYQFSSLANFLQGRARRVQLRAGTAERLERDIRMPVGGFFVQDDFRVSPRVTLNAGLRYEPYGVAYEANGYESTLRNAMDSEYTLGGRVFRNPSWKNLGPRLGFAWDMRGDGRMSLRGGAGVYHDILVPLIYRNVYSGSPPYSSVLTVDNPIFPDAAANLNLPGRPAVTSPDGIVYDARQPKLYHFNLQLETQLSPTMVVSVGYVGNRGHNQVRMIDGNTAVADIRPDGTKFFPTNSARRNPNFGGSWWRLTDGQSFYDGIRAKLSKRFSEGVQFGISYSLGKAIDDSSTDVGQTDFQQNASLPQDPDDRGSHRGRSNFDVRNNLSMNFSAFVPGTRGLTGARALVLGNWQVNGIVSIADGAPFTPLLGFDNARNRSRAFSQHPSLREGASLNPVLGGPEKYFDPEAFVLPEPGTYGNVGRNTIEGPGLALVDASAVKHFTLAGERRLEFRIEAFNLLNRANFAHPLAVIYDATGRVGSAGRITSTSTPARQIQLGAKFVF